MGSFDTVLPAPQTFEFQFNGISLHRYLTAIQDVRKGRVAVHEFLDRDGASTEEMGRAPHQFIATCAFLDERGFAFYKQFVKELEDVARTALLIHPIWGPMQATCLGVEKATTDIATGPNTITVQFEFIEAAVDQKLQKNSLKSLSVISTDIADTFSALTLATAAMNTVTAQVQGVGTTAAAYAAAVAASANTTTPDASLAQQLDEIAAQATALIPALLADPSNATDADAYDAVANAQGLYAACLRLQDAADQVRPPMTSYVVPGDVHYLALAARFYGIDGASRADEILTNNPFLPDPSRIAAGSVLQMASPTV